VVQKIALQINCKLGGTLWAVNIPLVRNGTMLSDTMNMVPATAEDFGFPFLTFSTRAVMVIKGWVLLC
jgi:hypothetical protein